MTVSSTVNRNDYVGNGVTTSFPYTFQIYADTDIRVFQEDTVGETTELNLNDDYTVTGAGNRNGGNVVLTESLADNYRLSIHLDIPLTQPSDYKNQGAFFGETHERSFDRLTKITQQLSDKIDRAVKFSETDTDYNSTLPSATQRASKLLGFDASGNVAMVTLAVDDDTKVQNIATLRMLTGSGNQTASTLGYYAAGDGGADSFYWDGDSSATDNGGTVIKPTALSDISSGRWLSVSSGYLNALCFGADNTGVNDCSAIFQTMLTLAVASGRPVYIPAGTYKNSGTSTAYAGDTTTRNSKIHIYGDGPATLIKTSVAPVFAIGDLNGFFFGGIVKDMRFQLTANTYFARGVIEIMQTQEYEVDNLTLEGGEFGVSAPYCGLLFKPIGSYQGKIDKLVAIGKGIVLFDITGNASAQEDTTSYNNCTAFYSYIGGFIRLGNGGRHNYVFDHFKHRSNDSASYPHVVGTTDQSDEFQETTLSATANAGDTSFTVSDGSKISGLNNTSYLLVGNAARTEIVAINSVAGTTVNLKHPLRFTHPVNGDLSDPWVINGRVGVHIAANTYNIQFKSPHFEQGAAGIVTDGTRNLSVDNFYCSSRDLVNVRAPSSLAGGTVNMITIGSGQLATNVGNAWGGGANPNMYGVRITAGAQACTGEKPQFVRFNGRIQSYGSTINVNTYWYNESGAINNVFFEDTGEGYVFPVRKLLKEYGNNTYLEYIEDPSGVRYSVTGDGKLFAGEYSGGTITTAAYTTLGAIVGKLQWFAQDGTSKGFIPLYDSIT